MKMKYVSFLHNFAKFCLAEFISTSFFTQSRSKQTLKQVQGDDKKRFLPKMCFLLILSVVLGCGSGGDPATDNQNQAANTPEPAAEVTFANISAEEVCKEIMENKDILILDVRREDEFNGNLGHLKGAILISVSELESRLSEIEEYKDKPMIVYCRSGGRSARASEILASNGFTDVKNMLGGMLGWNNADTESVECKDELLVK